MCRQILLWNWRDLKVTQGIADPTVTLFELEIRGSCKINESRLHLLLKEMMVENK